MEPQPSSCPYKGLIPYEEGDEQYFFGRDKEIQVVISNLFAARLTTFYGTSGVGKSSLLRAGVVAKLRADTLEMSRGGKDPDLVVVYFNEWQRDLSGRQGTDVLLRLKTRIRESLDQTLGEKDGLDLSTEAELSELIRAVTDHLNGDLMIILDQFEEYFLYHPNDDGSGSFASEFVTAVNQAGLPVSFLLSIREDGLSALDRFKGKIPNLFSNYLRLKPLSSSAARDAIQKPLERYNEQLSGEDRPVSIDDDLVEAVIEAVPSGCRLVGEAGQGETDKQRGSSEEGVETPYLQLVLERLWDKMNQEEKEKKARKKTSKKLTLKMYIGLGKAESIVKGHLDKVMTRLPTANRDVAAGLFHYLVTPSGTKIALTSTDLASYSKYSLNKVQSVLQTLSKKERILRSITGDRYELFHDALAPAVLDWRDRYVKKKEISEKSKKLVRIGGLIFLVFAVFVVIAGFTFKKITEADLRATQISLELEQKERIKAETEADLRATELRLELAQKERIKAEDETKKTKALLAADSLSADAEQELLLGNNDSALDLFNKAKSIYQTSGEKQKLAKTWIAIGKAQSLKESYAEAIEAYAKAHEIILDIKDKQLEATLLEKTAALQEQTGDLKGAIVSYEHAVEAYKVAGDPQGHGRVLERLAVYEEEREEHNRAARLYEDASHSFKIASDYAGLARTNYAIRRSEAVFSGAWGYLINLHTSQIHELTGEEVKVGRNTSDIKYNTISFSKNLISRRHLAIQRDFSVEDLRSLNGSTVNGVFLPYGISSKLSDGDIIGLAHYRVLQFRTTPPKVSVPPPGAWAIFIDNPSRTYRYLTEKEYSLNLSGNKLSLHEGNKKDALMRIRWISSKDKESLDGRVEVLDAIDDWFVRYYYKGGDYEYGNDLVQKTGQWLTGLSLPLQYFKLGPKGKTILRDGPRFQIIEF